MGGKSMSDNTDEQITQVFDYTGCTVHLYSL